MPAVIQADQLDGLIKTTQRHIIRDRKADIAQRLTKYPGVTMIFRGQMTTLDDGYGVEWNMSYDHSGTASQVGLFDTVTPATTLHQVRANLPFRHSRVHVSWDLREVSMNRSPARILNYTKEKLFEMDVSELEHLEGQVIGVPAAGDDQSVMGLQYWVYPPSDAGTANTTAPFTTTSTGGRVNLNLAAFSSGPGGISRVTYPRAAHWYQNYAAVTYGDLFTKMRAGFDEIEFETPVSYNRLGDGGTKHVILTTLADARAAADECRQQNENVGTDLSYYDGKAMVRGVLIQGWPKLSEVDNARGTAHHPFYVLDKSQFKPFALSGWNPYEVTESGGASQPVVVNRVRYRTWNMRSWNSKTHAMFTSNAS